MTRAVVVAPPHGWATADVASGWVSGLRSCGVTVGVFELASQLAWFAHAEVEGEYLDRDRVRAAVGLNLLGTVYECDPDVVVIVHGADIDWRAVATIRCPVVLICTESPYELEAQVLAASVMAPDVVLLNDPVGADSMSQIAPTFYVSHAYDPLVHYPGGGAHRWDCCFVGTGFAARAELLAGVDWSGINLALGGMWDNAPEVLRRYVLHVDDPTACIDNVDTAEIYRQSATGFNVYRSDSHGTHSTSDGWAIGPREVELAACGTWFARHPRGEGDDLFSMLPTFADSAELGDLIRWAITHPDERHHAATEARDAIADRTFAHHAAALLRRLDL